MKSYEKNGSIIFENEYILWSHAQTTGELVEAIVKYGSGENLISSPFSSIIEVDGVTYTAGAEPVSMEINGNRVTKVCDFYNAKGEKLPGCRMEYHITYGELGEGEYQVKFVSETPIKNVTTFRPVVLGIRGNFNKLGIRERYQSSPGYWSQNPVRWQSLNGGKRYGDAIPCLINQVPLSLLFLETGVEGIQLELGDELSVWDIAPGYAETAIIYQPGGYNIHLSTLLAHPGFTLAKEMTITFRLSLPWVKKNIVPLRRASCGICYDREFDKRWPDDNDLKLLAGAGYDLLRIHCDADTFKNGIFWRGATYPPFPPDEMAKMDDFIVRTHRYGIKVVPYFSVKEMHPKAVAYPKYAKEWAHLATKTTPVKSSKFGSVMCLASGWEKYRKEMISKPLENHDFDGIYYDWCVGIECNNHAHCERTHWDNDQLLEHIKWTIRTFGDKQGERYLHLTFCPSLAVENTATMVLTEENGYAEITPEMFSPHVHFLNIAPRSICDEVPKSADDTNRLRFAMCALLHHASVSSMKKVYRDFYAGLDWLDSVVKYTRHAAPGEGIISTENENVGFALYWNKLEMLIIGANLSEKPQVAEYKIKLPNRPVIIGKQKIPPLSINTHKRQV